MDMSNRFTEQMLGQFLWFKAFMFQGFMVYSLLCLYGCFKNILIVHKNYS